MTDAIVWLSCYVYIFAISTYLTTTNACLTIPFSKKSSVIGMMSSRWSKTKKNHQTIGKLEISEITIFLWIGKTCKN